MIGYDYIDFYDQQYEFDAAVDEFRDSFRDDALWELEQEGYASEDIDEVLLDSVVERLFQDALYKEYLEGDLNPDWVRLMNPRPTLMKPRFNYEV